MELLFIFLSLAILSLFVGLISYTVGGFLKVTDLHKGIGEFLINGGHLMTVVLVVSVIGLLIGGSGS